MELLKRIEAIIEEPLTGRGYSVVRLQLSGANRKVLQIMIERLDDAAINVDDCSIVSRLVSVLLDVQDPIKDPYTLEVSSPGLERPLVKLRDYQRFCGQPVVVTTHQPVNGCKRFQGRLTSADENGITLDLLSAPKEGASSIIIELANIRAARLFIDFEKGS